MSERTPEYLGPFAVHLRSFIEEKRLLGCRYMEEERLAHKFDHMSMEYDSSGGLSPNWSMPSSNISQTGRQQPKNGA